MPLLFSKRQSNLFGIYDSYSVFMESKREEYSEYVRDNLWKVRSSTEYKNEHDECTSVRGRFHQYFIHGSVLDCSSWKNDLRNCELCLLKHDNKACLEIINHENRRRFERLKGHVQNDVWKKRVKPPENWNGPIPDYCHKNEPNSMFGELGKNIEEHKSCTIS